MLSIYIDVMCNKIKVIRKCKKHAKSDLFKVFNQQQDAIPIYS
jgi:hypothetical protein